MKHKVIAFLLILAAAVLFNSNLVTAIQSGETQASIKPAPIPNHPLTTLRRDFKDSLPFPVGEKLEYEVKFSRFALINASVGIVTFEYLGAINNKPISENDSSGSQSNPLIKGLNVEFNPAPDEQLVHMRATAVSKGMLTALFGIDVKARYETLVDANDFSARLSFMEMKEDKKHIVQTAVFDRAGQQVKYLTTDFAKPDQAPRAKFLPHQEGMLSLLSAIYFTRLQKYKEDHLLRFPVSHEETNYLFDIVIDKREKIRSECGKVKTVRLDPKLFGPGQLISRQGEMSMWVTDDNKHIPVRLEAKTSAGTVSAKLINYKSNCKILDPETLEQKKSNKNAK